MSEKIISSLAPEPVGSYPHARKVGNLLFLSGVGPRQKGSKDIPGVTLDNDDNIVDYCIETQCKSVFDNVKTILEASGSGWDQLVDVQVFLTNMKDDFKTYNRIYAEYFAENQPCRTTIEINCLPTPIAIELKCIAVFKEVSMGSEHLISHPTTKLEEEIKCSDPIDTTPFKKKPIAPFNFNKWIDDHRDVLKPPVCNKEIFHQGDFIVMVVGGPNGRRDYHWEEGPEFFYQLEGEMLLKTIQDGKKVDYPLKAGDVFLLPPEVPHSPVRFANSIGLVVERKRTAEEKDGLMWFCENCDHKLYEEYFHLSNIEKDFFPVFERFLNDENNRTCKKCGTIMPKENKLDV